ncbi:hypothetical protein CHS0354_032004 [Potamilus streckersoni]|uniref:Uncharacterized protein n=1 Tax=Potamilus streckersoni TaxID=2493646 RepID=A0AAE0WHK7_9BIVA|nr:hypothetical protein CHS0354_032004 [Potamilus streckersoni]
MGSGRKLIPVTLFLIALSLLLQLISFVSPGWMVITFNIKSESSIESKIDIWVALWYTRTCVTGGINESCTTWFYQDMARITAGGLPRVEVRLKPSATCSACRT